MLNENPQKPDPQVTGAMVLVNWLRHKRNMTYDQMRVILGLAQISSIGVLRRFEVNPSDGTKWDRIFENVPPECFLWNWQEEAREYLLKRQYEPYSDATEIDSIIQAISGPSGCITPTEAAKWADEINSGRRK